MIARTHLALAQKMFQQNKYSTTKPNHSVFRTLKLPHYKIFSSK